MCLPRVPNPSAKLRVAMHGYAQILGTATRAVHASRVHIEEAQPGGHTRKREVLTKLHHWPVAPFFMLSALAVRSLCRPLFPHRCRDRVVLRKVKSTTYLYSCTTGKSSYLRFPWARCSFLRTVPLLWPVGRHRRRTCRLSVALSVGGN